MNVLHHFLVADSLEMIIYAVYAVLFVLEDGAMVLLGRTVVIAALHLDDLHHIFICRAFGFAIRGYLFEWGIELQWFSWI